ncbi:MAG: PKD domain-containing protein [Anaerolineae bacterium]|nr:PKD domain-containing protein [Anaerolineae bacterium]MDW8098472.1 PKD domain-containing protein [Anaerolineae bacterium]
MKAKQLLISILVFVLTPSILWTVGAQGPQPPVRAPAEPSVPPVGPEWEGKLFLGESAPLARLRGEKPGVEAAAIPLGQPGLSFRYVQTFGVTEEPYIETDTHFYYVEGISTIGNAVWIGDHLGSRVLKFDANGDFIRKIGKAGVRDYTNGSLYRVTDVVEDASGNVWVVDAESAHVAKFDSSGKRVAQLGQMWNRGADNARFNDPFGIAIDSAGNVYISDSGYWGSDYGNNRVQIFNSSGNHIATIGGGPCGTGSTQLCWPRYIAIYGNRLYVADAANHRVQIFNINNPAAPSYIATLGQTSSPGSGNNQFREPHGVAVDANYIYVADTRNHRVQIFNRNTMAYVATLGTGYGTGTYQFNFPTDVAIDASGNIYVADFGNKRVQQYNSSHVYQRTYGTTGISYVTTNDRFNHPESVAIGPDESIYVVEGLGHRLIKLDASGIPQWVKGEAGQQGDDNAHFSLLTDVAVGPDGRIYTLEGRGLVHWMPGATHRLQIFNPDGSYYSGFGGHGSGNYQFINPRGLGFDRQGNLYIADCGNHRVQIYNRNFAYVATLGVTGQSGSTNDRFNCPSDVAVDKNGYIYVADDGNNRIQVFDSNRQYVRTIGGGGTGNSFDRFSDWGPHHLAVDSQERLYVTDSGNSRVQVFDNFANGNAYLTTIGGVSGVQVGRFRHAFGIAIGPDDSVYISEVNNNHRIQKFAPGVPGWKQVNINGFGDRQNIWISSLASFKGHLYATGFQPYVWRLEPDGTWRTVNTLGFGDSTNDEIDAMAVFHDHLYVATFTFVCDDPNCSTWHTNGPQFWRTADGIHWENVTPPGSIGSDYRWVPIMASFGGHLYATLERGDRNTLGAEIWRTADGQNWQRIASGGFDDPYNTGVLSLAEYNGYLYAGTRHGDWQDDAHSNGPLGGEVWRYDGANWTQVNNPGFGDVEAHRVEKLIVFNNALYAYISRVGGTSKGAEVWRCTATICSSQSDWIKVADNGFNNPQNQYIFGGAVFGGHLYAAVANYSTGLQLWRTANGTDWELVADGGLGDSNNSYVWLSAMAVHNNRLYLGTTNWANGGEVWKKTVTADFSASPRVGSPGTAVTFTNLSGGDVTIATWDFGDGSAPLVSNAPTVQHTYNTPGSYTVILTVQDGVDTDVKARSAYIRIAHRLFLPLVTREYNPLMILYDDFNNPLFDGLYNPLKWRFGGDSSYFTMQQQNGVMMLTTTGNAPAERDTVMVVNAPFHRTLRQVQRFQARLKFSADANRWAPKIQIVAENIGTPGRDWWTSCDLFVHSFGCGIASSTGHEWDVSSNQPVYPNQWYEARIEIDPETVRICFYFNNTLLGCRIPNDANLLKTAATFTMRIGAWNGVANPTGTLYFDDVYITPAGL